MLDVEDERPLTGSTRRRSALLLGPTAFGRSARRRQDGFTLIEVVVAVGMASLLIVSLSSGLLFLIRTNATLTADQQLQRVLGNLSESLKSLEYVSCADEGVGPQTPPPANGTPTTDSATMSDAYLDQLVNGPAAVLEAAGTAPGGATRYQPTDDWRPVEGITVQIVRVEFWQKVSFPAPVSAPSTTVAGPGAFVESCPFERTTDGALVQVAGQPVVIDDGAQLLVVRAHLGDRSATVEVITTDRTEAPGAGP